MKVTSEGKFLNKWKSEVTSEGDFLKKWKSEVTSDADFLKKWKSVTHFSLFKSDVTHFSSSCLQASESEKIDQCG